MNAARRLHNAAKRVRRPEGLVWWIERTHVWLVRRPAKGLLGGMAALPGDAWGETPVAPHPQLLGTVRHVFTHFALDLQVVCGSETVDEGWWQPLDTLADAGLPTLYRRASEIALGVVSAERRAA